MSMEMLNALQFTQLLCGYLGFTILLPALVFYRKVKGFPAACRFLIYVTIGNFYIINLVQVLELMFISYRSTLLLFTLVPVGFAAVRMNRIPVASYCGKLGDELQHFLLRELGFRSFVHHRLREMNSFLRWAGRQLMRLLKEVWLDLPFLAVFLWVMWKISWPGILYNWGFGASDLPVHNYWINGLIDNKLYIGGIYPMGMHCMLYYLAMVLRMPAYVILRLFWLIQYTMVSVVLLAFLKSCCKTRFLPWLGLIGFVGLKWFAIPSYSRFGATLPQEFGTIFILPAIYFAVAFFREREMELQRGINRIRCTSSWLLLGFAISFSLTVTTHFYNAIAAGILCIGVAVGYGKWFLRKEYFWRVMAAGVLGVLLAFLPMAVAFLAGKPLQGSMYWAMSIIGLREYTVLIFRIICLGVVGITAVGIALIIMGTRRGRISLEQDKPIPNHSLLSQLLLEGIPILLLTVILVFAWTKKETLMWGMQESVIRLPDNRWLLRGAVVALLTGGLRRYVTEKQAGAASLSMLVATVLMVISLSAGNLGLPSLMQPARVCIFTAYLLPVVGTMILDSMVSLLLPVRIPILRMAAAWVLTAALLVCGSQAGLLRNAFGGGNLEMNEAILCTTNILRDNQGKNDKWTIVSANDELQMTEQYGWHTETITFLENMEYWNENKEVKIPTDRVYFYIEKKPLNYANGYNGIIPEVSEEEAGKPLPTNSGLNAYNGTNRAITMSRMYYWAQAFRKLYPNELKVYYENERFVCYYIEQNPYRLYNFAIDYGCNSYN